MPLKTRVWRKLSFKLRTVAVSVLSVVGVLPSAIGHALRGRRKCKRPVVMSGRATEGPTEGSELSVCGWIPFALPAYDRHPGCSVDVPKGA